MNTMCFGWIRGWQTYVWKYISFVF